MCTQIDGTVRQFPITKIMLDGEFVKGNVKVSITYFTGVCMHWLCSANWGWTGEV